jgi:hypothetical protein
MPIEAVSVEKRTVEGCLAICVALAGLSLENSNLLLGLEQVIFTVIELFGPDLREV